MADELRKIERNCKHKKIRMKNYEYLIYCGKEEIAKACKVTLDCKEDK